MNWTDDSGLGRGANSIFEMRLRTRLMLGFMVVCSIMVAVVSASIWRTGILNEDATRIANVNSPFAVGTARIHALLEATHVELQSVVSREAGNGKLRTDEWTRLWSLIREAEEDLAPLAKAWSSDSGNDGWQKIRRLVDTLWRAQSRLVAVERVSAETELIDQLDAQIASISRSASTMLGEMATTAFTAQDKSSRERGELLLRLAAQVTRTEADVIRYSRTGDTESAARLSRDLLDLEDHRERIESVVGTGDAARRAVVVSEIKRIEAIAAQIVQVRSSDSWQLRQTALQYEILPVLAELRQAIGSFETGSDAVGLHRRLNQALDIDRDAVAANVSFLSIVLWSLLIAGIVISSTVVSFISKAITGPVEEIREAIGRLAEGEHDVTIPHAGGITEFVELADAVKVFRNNSEQIIGVTEGIAGGDFSKKVPLRGKKDALAISVNRMVDTLRAIVHQAVLISEGDYGVLVKPKSNKDDLGSALFEMTTSLQELSEAVEAIAIGDFSKQVRIKGPNDLLAVGVNSLVDNFHMVARQANRIAGGDFASAVAPLSERDEIGQAISRMTDSLREKDAENHRQSWLKSAQTDIVEKLSGDHSLTDLCSRAIGYIAWYLEAQVGVVYVSQREGTLTLMGRYACTKDDDVPEEIEFGSGLVGQCALGREVIEVSGVEEDYLHVNSALGRGRPRHVIVVPVLLRGTIRGVMELCSVNAFSRVQRQLVEAIANSLSISITSAESREETRFLLSRSQELSRELQAGHEEMEEKNIEMSKQTKALVRSEVRLRRKTTELLDANEELARKTEDLEQQSAELEQSSKYKSEFLANVSHELRTPLNSLLILAEVLGKNRSGNLDQQELESVQVIYEGGKELLTLINDILDLSKVEAGMLDVHVDRVSVEYTAKSLRKRFMPLVANRPVELRLDISDDCPSDIWTDPHRLDQILKNLLSNAVKFTQTGSVQLRVHRGSEVELRNTSLVGTEAVIFSVEDTGIGIPAEQREAIFESFQQGDGSTSRSYGGTGLGLTICRHLASLLMGEVHLERSGDTGSLFTLILPVGVRPVDTTGESTDAESHSTSPSQLPAHQITEPPSHGKLAGRKVLLVDDDMRNAFALSKALRDCGIEVDLADNGLRALERLHDGTTFDLVLMDIMMPVMDGLTAIESMRSEEDLADLPVIALTAKVLSEERVRCMESGASAFLAKPLDLEELLNEMEKWIPGEDSRT